MSIHIQPLTEEYFEQFIGLIRSLAAYEKLNPPADDAIERLHDDAFRTHRFNAILAFDGHQTAVGYAIFFETYSSFLAKPTVYLEDLFVLESARQQGAGTALFNYVYEYGKSRDCGRMEWQVLEWNQLAREFYHNKKAEHLSDWLTYRITL